MLSSGAQRLAESKAVVKTLTDVETLGGTTVINSDKTGTLTMNAMTATTMLAGGDWFRIEGGGYEKTGAILGAGGATAPGLPPAGAGPVRCARTPPSPTTSRSSAIPTEAALVVLAAKIGVDAEQTRQDAPAPRRGPVRLRVQVHGDVPRPPGLARRRDPARAAFREREGRPGRRDRPLRSARSGTATSCRSTTVRERPAGREPAAVRAGACASWRSRRRDLDDAADDRRHRRSDGRRHRSDLRRAGRDHRPASRGGEGRRAGRPRTPASTFA